MKKITLLAILVFCFSSAFAQSNQPWITAASGVKARASAATTSEEIARLPIGTLLKQIDDDKRAATIGDKKDFWYHVALPNNKDGWVFGAFLLRFDETKRGEIYLKIARAKAKPETPIFAESADLTRFLATALTEIKEQATLAELEMWRFVAMQKTFESIPVDKLQQPEYQRFIKAHQVNAAYSEPGGIWIVKADLLWNLSKKNADLPIADQIAWEAASLPIPGECETDDTCHISLMNMTQGNYLHLYPKGKFANEALDKLIEAMQGINEMMKNIATPKGNTAADKKIRKEALAVSAKLRANLTQVTNPKKTKLLQLLTHYEKTYSAPKK